MQSIAIRHFHPGDQPAFERLNRIWIEQYFVLEEKDRKVLSHPEEHILGASGTILLAEQNGEVVGCCALTPLPPDSMELSKMAVSTDHHRRGMGEALLKAAIEHARAHGFKRLFLESNRKLPAAIRLYEKCGFTMVPPEQVVPSAYRRVDVRMELYL